MAKLASVEAENALRQFDEVRRLFYERRTEMRLSPSDVCNLQSIAVKGIFADAGQYRRIEVEISNSPHTPPSWPEIPRHVDDMCIYANSVTDRPVHAAAYLMWRHNWIHPFADGNGRTSRAISYLALCCGYGIELPGTVTVPDLIVNNRDPYYHALDEADAAWRAGSLDVSAMEALIEALLTEQLASN